MSKYTTEVRFICENLAGLVGSVGFDEVDNVIANSWNKIFTSKVELFDENYRQTICSKILKHYYTREIGAETVGLWKLWLNTKFEEIMPYYNQLYMSANLIVSPLEDVDYTKSGTRNVDGTTDNTGTRNVDNNVNNTGNNTVKTNTTNTENNGVDNVSRDLYADTPQGGLQGLESEEYLTNARKITDNTTETKSATGVGEQANNYTENRVDKRDETYVDKGVNSTDEVYNETVKGKIGAGSKAKLLQEYRQTMLNIDMMVIEEFEGLFMQLW